MYSFPWVPLTLGARTTGGGYGADRCVCALFTTPITATSTTTMGHHHQVPTQCKLQYLTVKFSVGALVATSKQVGAGCSNNACNLHKVMEGHALPLCKLPSVCCISQLHVTLWHSHCHFCFSLQIHKVLIEKSASFQIATFNLSMDASHMA